MSEWITYDWHVHNDPAQFCVTTQYADGAPVGFSTLLFIAASPRSHDAALFTPGEYRRLKRIEGKLIKALGDAVFVGFIHMDSLRQFYFYTGDGAGAFEIAEDIAYAEKKLYLMPDITDEPDWLTYNKLLLPDTAKFQTIYNGQLIERQRAAGDALEKARRVSFLVCFATEQQRHFFNEDARKAGFAIGDPLFSPELALSHVQTLYAITSLDKRDIDELTTRAIRCALPHEGEFLRWTCPKMAKKSPLM